MILEVHDLKFIRGRSFHRFAFWRLTRSKTFQHLVAISAALAADVVALYPYLQGRVRVAHDGADPVDPQMTAADLPGRKGALRAGYVGNIYPGRGLEVLQAIAQQLPWLDLHIVGNWDERFYSMGSSCSLSNVHVHGFLPFAEAERVRIACDVLLAPYQLQIYTPAGSDIARYISPIKLFEYMAAGKPIVCSDIPVLHEVLTHDETAWFCPPDDIGAWCAVLTQFRENPELRTRLGEAARDVFMRSYTWRSRAAVVL